MKPGIGANSELLVIHLVWVNTTISQGHAVVVMESLAGGGSL